MTGLVKVPEASVGIRLKYSVEILGMLAGIFALTIGRVSPLCSTADGGFFEGEKHPGREVHLATMCPLAGYLRICRTAWPSSFAFERIAGVIRFWLFCLIGTSRGSRLSSLIPQLAQPHETDRYQRSRDLRVSPSGGGLRKPSSTTFPLPVFRSDAIVQPSPGMGSRASH
jgi:hypothetical protein